MFCSLELDLLLPIADKLVLINIGENEILFDSGEHAYNMYLIAEGSVVIKDKYKRELTVLDKGQVFGEESIFSGIPRDYCAQSKTKVALLTLTQADLLALIHEYPKVATGFIEMYARATPFRPR